MNAFNLVRRDHVLQTCLDRTPEITKLSFIAYSKSSLVIASGHSITSSTGVQQGDPIGPLLFALAVDQIASGVESDLNVWYHDDTTTAAKTSKLSLLVKHHIFAIDEESKQQHDTTIGGSPESFLSYVQRCITGFMWIGLKVNPKKTEIISHSELCDELLYWEEIV